VASDGGQSIVVEHTGAQIVFTDVERARQRARQRAGDAGDGDVIAESRGRGDGDLPHCPGPRASNDMHARYSAFASRSTNSPDEITGVHRRHLGGLRTQMAGWAMENLYSKRIDTYDQWGTLQTCESILPR
jgi:hypothetical protein